MGTEAHADHVTDAPSVCNAGADEAAIEQMVEEAKAAALEMQPEIDDCLVEANWHGEVRQVIEDAARTGSGVKRAVSEEKDGQNVPRQWSCRS